MVSVVFGLLVGGCALRYCVRKGGGGGRMDVHIFLLNYMVLIAMIIHPMIQIHLCSIVALPQ